MPLAAEIVSAAGSADSRAAERRLLRLAVTASTEGETAEAFVHNLSERGLLLQTSAELRAGDALAVELPIAGVIAATVVWGRDGLFGCAFERPVSRAVVSAALLRSPAMLPELTVGRMVPTLEDYRSLWSGEESWLHGSSEPDQPPAAIGPVLAGLILALATAALFVWALLAFPFSVS